MAKGNAHFIPLDCPGADPIARATEIPDSTIRAAKAAGTSHCCFQKLDEFLLSSPAIVT